MNPSDTVDLPWFFVCRNDSRWMSMPSNVPTLPDGSLTRYTCRNKTYQFDSQDYQVIDRFDRSNQHLLLTLETNRGEIPSRLDSTLHPTTESKFRTKSRGQVWQGEQRPAVMEIDRTSTRRYRVGDFVCRSCERSSRTLPGFSSALQTVRQDEDIEQDVSREWYVWGWIEISDSFQWPIGEDFRRATERREERLTFFTLTRLVIRSAHSDEYSNCFRTFSKVAIKFL